MDGRGKQQAGRFVAGGAGAVFPAENEGFGWAKRCPFSRYQDGGVDVQGASVPATEEVIAALASATGPGERGIVRLSGEQTVAVMTAFSREQGIDWDVQPRQARRYAGTLGAESLFPGLPIALFLWPGRRSYTGQPAAELHLLSAPAILDWVLERLFALGARPARPGEFTLRSFLAGQVSLVQAEAVLGVIDARTDQQLDQALSQLAGGLSRQMREMRKQLLDDLADLEAGLDFVEEDIEFIDRAEFAERLQRMWAALTTIRDGAERRMTHQSAPKVVLAGLPNAGKSSLFNALTGSRAIVSQQAGTTTDYLVADGTACGVDFQLHDTAGWEAAADLAEAGGIRWLAQQVRDTEARQADLIVWCSARTLPPAERDLDERLYAQVSAEPVPCLRVWTKADVPVAESAAEEADSDRFSSVLPSGHQPGSHLLISVVTGSGLERLREQLAEQLQQARQRHWELLGTTAARCGDALRRACEHLEQACQLADAVAGEEFLAEEIRATLQELGEILGHVYTDDLLDRVFSKFCIGK